MSDRWWILDAAAHRVVERKAMPQTMTVGGEEVPVFGIVPDDNDDWLCDFCNAKIQTRRTLQIGQVERVVPAMVPMLASNALCVECASRHGFPARWEQPPILFCACEGCEKQAEQMEREGIIEKEVQS